MNTMVLTPAKYIVKYAHGDYVHGAHYNKSPKIEQLEATDPTSGGLQ